MDTSHPYFLIQWRMILERRTKKRPGSQIQTNSLFRTTHPLELKKDFTLMGETWIGVQGRKYRLEEKGEKNATPRPPFVIASRRPWLIQTTKKRKKYQNQRTEKSGSFRKKTIIRKKLTIRPKNGE
jgi:hypothetical protein